MFNQLGLPELLHTGRLSILVTFGADVLPVIDAALKVSYD